MRKPFIICLIDAVVWTVILETFTYIPMSSILTIVTLWSIYFAIRK